MHLKVFDNLYVLYVHNLINPVLASNGFWAALYIAIGKGMDISLYNSTGSATVYDERDHSFFRLSRNLVKFKKSIFTCLKIVEHIKIDRNFKYKSNFSFINTSYLGIVKLWQTVFVSGSHFLEMNSSSTTSSRYWVVVLVMVMLLHSRLNWSRTKNRFRRDCDMIVTWYLSFIFSWPNCISRHTIYKYLVGQA